MTSLYGNVGGSRKTISSAYCNIGGSRKQIYPYATQTVYTYREYNINDYMIYTGDLPNDGACIPIYGISNYSSLKSSYSFNSSTGTFTVSGSSPSKPSLNTNSQAGVGGTTYYYKYSDYIIFSVVGYCFLNCAGFEGIISGTAYYGYPDGYSSSYSQSTSTSNKDTGYIVADWESIECINWDLNGDDSYYEFAGYMNIPIYSGSVYRTSV